MPHHPDARVVAERNAAANAAADSAPATEAKTKIDLTKAKVVKPKKLSRPQRWAEAASKLRQAADEAEAALSELQEIQSEYSDWRDNLPENMQSGGTAEKLDAVCDLDLERTELSDLAEEVESVELPQGFGRD